MLIFAIDLKLTAYLFSCSGQKFKIPKYMYLKASIILFCRKITAQAHTPSWKIEAVMEPLLMEKKLVCLIIFNFHHEENMEISTNDFNQYVIIFDCKYTIV